MKEGEKGRRGGQRQKGKAKEGKIIVAGRTEGGKRGRRRVRAKGRRRHVVVATPMVP